MRVKRDPVWLAQIAARLQATAHALRLQDNEMAAHAKVRVSTWSNYMNAIRPLDIEGAIRLCDRFHLTLDWLYRGDLSGLPQHLVDKLEPPKRGAVTKIIPLGKGRR